MSFSDLMSSARGPGVIGTLLALVVLAGFGFLFLMAFDEGMQGKSKTLAATIAEQANEIEECQARVAGATKRLEVLPGLTRTETELAAMIDANRDRKEHLDELAKTRRVVDEQNAALLVEIDTYRDAYRGAIRGQAKGLKMDLLKTLDGKVFTKVTVNKVTAQAMHVQHADGVAAIPYEMLPAEMQDLYQFDTQEKQRLLAAERKATQEYSQSVENSVKQTKDNVERQRKAKAEADKLRRVQDVAMLKQRLAKLRLDITAQQDAIRLEKRKSLSRAPAMEARLRDMNTELADLTAKLAELETLN